LEAGRLEGQEDKNLRRSEDKKVKRKKLRRREDEKMGFESW